MIQRIQTLWLLAASACGFVTVKVPFYIGSIGNAPAEELSPMTNNNMLLLVLTIAMALLALFDIFLYKNRDQQLKISIIALLMSLVNLILYFTQIRKYTTGGISLWCLFAFVIPVLLFLAARSIYKDEKMVKSLDRLR